MENDNSNIISNKTKETKIYIKKTKLIKRNKTIKVLTNLY